MTALPEPTKHGSLLVTKIPLKESGEHVYATAYSPDGKYLAATFSNGCLRIFDSVTFEPVARAKLGSGFDDFPSTSVAWRPPHEDTEEGMYDLVSVSSAGALFGWCLDVTDPGSVFLDRMWKQVEQGNETSVVDYAPDSTLIATAGSDRIVRTYDPNAKGKPVAKLEFGRDEAGHTRPAHTNRIFSLKFASPQIILTGGWEAPMQAWDIRTGYSERQIPGAAISSNGIEVTQGSQTVLTASKRDHTQLQVFDYLSGRENPSDSQKLSANVGKNALTQVRFSPDAMLVWTATSKPDVLLCLDYTNGEVKGCLDSGALGTILCLTLCPGAPNRLIVGSMNEGLYLVEYTN